VNNNNNSNNTCSNNNNNNRLMSAWSDYHAGRQKEEELKETFPVRYWLRIDQDNAFIGN